MKKVWEKPKLVALVRGKPEERVLVACKGPGLTGPDEIDCVINLGFCEEPSKT